MKSTAATKRSLTTPTTTTVFVSGNSQAVRLPKEFRVNTRTLEISRRGDEIVLRERSATIAETLADLPAPSAHDAEAFDAVMKLARSAPESAEERDFSWMQQQTRDTRAKRTVIKRRSAKR